MYFNCFKSTESTTILILYRALLKKWGAGAALFGVAIAGFGLRFALGYGNYTEEYALLFNAIGVSLFISMMVLKMLN